MVFEVLYQDNNLIAINKPEGWLVHRSWLDKNETVVVMQTLRDQIGQHVYPIHRLDRPTSGVLVFALSSDIAHLLSQQFAEKQIEKTYHAIVRGYVDGEDTIDYPLVEELDKIADKFASKDKPAQEAITFYKGLSKIELPIAVGKYSTARYSFVELKPQTGRKHQLRRHLKHIFHPIIG
nr:tRNA pseudouridine(65) synthase TruC [Gilliamella apicola]